jgi:hypothetical protein
MDMRKKVRGQLRLQILYPPVASGGIFVPSSCWARFLDERGLLELHPLRVDVLRNI